MDKGKSKPFKVIGAFDTETSNVGGIATGRFAFPCLYQIGEVLQPVETITADNAEKAITVNVYREAEDAFGKFDNIISNANNYVPVVLVHNLGFDMYAMASWLLSKKTRVLAKTGTKPISFQVLDDSGEPALVFLDTLGLFMKSLSTLGEECGMPKAVGDWDYSKVRTPETPLTEQELNYARRDIVTLIVYTGYFLRQNPEIKPWDVGKGVQTKTGVVRAKRIASLSRLKGRNLKRKVGEMWHMHNRMQRPKDNEELFTMHASTRGGFTFCSRNNASAVFHSGNGVKILSYDSTSQHPAQMTSHLYPQSFSNAEPGLLIESFNICASLSVDFVLRHWSMPFPYAFCACFRFANLRPKPGSVFAQEGIYPLASARFSGEVPLYDNEAARAFKETMGAKGYKDTATGATCSFGKLEGAETCELYLTELEAWVISRCYSWDSIEAVHGLLSHTFRKPPDMAVLSVMRFYKAKNALKEFMGRYKKGTPNDVSAISGLFPDSFVSRCKGGDAEHDELAEYYALSKADLNSLF